MKKFKEINGYLKDQPLNGGIQYLYKFKNNYGASVVKHNFSYGGKNGLWELAVLFWNNNEYELTYDTPITNDVLGYLSQKEVVETLIKINKLK